MAVLGMWLAKAKITLKDLRTTLFLFLKKSRRLLWNHNHLVGLCSSIQTKCYFAKQSSTLFVLLTSPCGKYHCIRNSLFRHRPLS